MPAPFEPDRIAAAPSRRVSGQDLLHELASPAVWNLPSTVVPDDPRALVDWLGVIAANLEASRAFMLYVPRGANGDLDWPTNKDLRHTLVACCSRQGTRCPNHDASCCLQGLPAPVLKAAKDLKPECHEARFTDHQGVHYEYWLDCPVLLPDGELVLLLVKDPHESTEAVPFRGEDLCALPSQVAILATEALSRATLGASAARYMREALLGPSAALADAAECLLFYRCWFLSRASQAGAVADPKWPRVAVHAEAPVRQTTGRVAILHGWAPPGQTHEAMLDDIIADMLSALLYQAREATDRRDSLGPREARRLWLRLGRALLGQQGAWQPDSSGASLTVHLSWPPPRHYAERGGGEGSRSEGPRLTIASSLDGPPSRASLVAAAAFAWMSYALRERLYGEPRDREMLANSGVTPTGLQELSRAFAGMGACGGHV